MKDRVDCHSIAVILVENGERESPDDRATIAFMHDLKPFRISAKALDACLDAAEEIFAKPSAPTLMPSVRLIDVVRGLRRENEISAHNGYESRV